MIRIVIVMMLCAVLLMGCNLSSECSHVDNWSNWSEVRNPEATYSAYQQRKCSQCNKVERRDLQYGLRRTIDSAINDLINSENPNEDKPRRQSPIPK